MLLFRCSEDEERRRILDRHQSLASEIRFLSTGSSANDQLNRLICDPDGPNHLCLVHESVTLPASFSQRLIDLGSDLATNWPNWGLVGNAGVTPLMYGGLASRRVRFFSDAFTGPNLSGHIIPAENLFENVLLINCANLRSTDFRLPDVPDSHLLATLLSIETLRAGRAALVAPQLACFRDFPIEAQSNFQTTVSQAGAEWIAQRIANTTCDLFDGYIDLLGFSDRFWTDDRFDTALRSLLNAQQGRIRQRVEVITRTKHERPGMLRRNISTVGLFIERASHADFVHSIISGANAKEEIDLPGNVIRLSAREFSAGDDRFRLIFDAASAVSGSYLWFIDDDDWLFPNAAELISLMVSVSPKGSTFFVDVMHFVESGDVAKSNDWPNGLSAPARRFPASHFALSLEGQNYIPFCGIILDRDLVVGLPTELFERITFFEDYTLVLASLMAEGSFPVAVDALAAGISMREGDHSATQSNRQEWNASQAELSLFLSEVGRGSSLLSLGSLLSPERVGLDVRGRASIGLSPLSRRRDFLISILGRAIRRLRGGRIWKCASRSSGLRKIVVRFRTWLS